MIATCQALSWFPYIIISFNPQKKSSQNPTLFLQVGTVRLGVDQCCVGTVNLVSLRSGACSPRRPQRRVSTGQLSHQ